MPTIEIAVSASNASNDHQARILADRVDLLHLLGFYEELGLDPPELVQMLRNSRADTLVIGRCSCGSVGCGDIVAVVAVAPSTIIWTISDRQIEFEKAQYEAEIRRFSRDESWRPLDRLVELRIDEMFKGLRLDGRLEFRWASARIKSNVISLSFDCRGVEINGYAQQLLEFTWDGATLRSAIDRAHRFRAERFEGQSH